jgi:glycosyltransferase involved in cell wall biosynthesis
MEHVNAILIDELLKKGADVVVATLTKIDVVKLFREKFDVTLCRSPKIYSLFPASVTSLPIFQPFWNWFSMLNCINHENPDVIYIDGYYYAIPKYFKRKAKIIVYDNEPVPVNEKSEAKLEKKFPIYVRVYSKLFDYLLKSIADREGVDKVICNSQFSAKLYEKTFKKVPEVVVPPICTAKFSTGNKENLVTCVGVFTPRKRFERTIEAIALSKSKPKLAIIGSLPPGGDIYMSYLKRLSKQLGIEERVSFYPNSNFTELREIISRSKICVSNGIEYFGIALVEQMAAGCVPVVYKWTAPWEDIVAEGKFGFGFETCEDLANIIDQILSNEGLQTKMSNISRIRAQEFDEQVFREKITNLLLFKS